MPATLRLLAAIRQSVTQDVKHAREDPATSPRRQHETIDKWADYKGHTVTLWAEDLDTSGAIPPLERPDLGKMLLDLDSYDAVIVTRLDRLCRSLYEFLAFYEWLKERGKSLIVLDPDIDMTTHWGRAVAHILMTFSELEREMIRDRVKGGYEDRQRLGRYSGRQFPFGYEPVALTFHPDGSAASWGYQESAKYAPVVRLIVDMVLARKSLGSIARYLNAEQILTPRDMVREFYGNPSTGGKWEVTIIRRMIFSDNLLGLVTNEDGEVLYGEDQKPVKRAEPIVDYAKLMRAREILEANRNRRGPRIGSSMLLRVAFCKLCGEPLYTSYKHENGRRYRYYICQSGQHRRVQTAGVCPAQRIPAEALEDRFLSRLLAEIGDVDPGREHYFPGTDHTEEMRAIAGAIGKLTSDIEYRQALGEDVTQLEATREERRSDLAKLRDKDYVPPRTEIVPCGKTWSQLWREFDDSEDPNAERNAYLRSKGIRCEAWIDPGRKHDRELHIEMRTGFRDYSQGEPTGDYLDVAPA
jgi:site-specific DNA recombinase